MEQKITKIFIRLLSITKACVAQTNILNFESGVLYFIKRLINILHIKISDYLILHVGVFPHTTHSCSAATFTRFYDFSSPALYELLFSVGYQENCMKTSTLAITRAIHNFSSISTMLMRFWHVI